MHCCLQGVSYWAIDAPSASQLNTLHTCLNTEIQRDKL